MTILYDEQQLEALGELASIGSGTAAAALARMLARPVELDVPCALALPLADALDAVGEPERMVATVVIPVGGDADLVVLLLLGNDCAARLCELVGVEPRTDLGDSALGEIGNVLGAAAVGALAQLTGLALEPEPPQVLHDLLGAVVASALTATAGHLDLALVLEARLTVAHDACELTFLLLPTEGATGQLLRRYGDVSLRQPHLAADQLVEIP